MFMLKRYSWILSLMVVALLGIIAIHAYFAHQDFRIKTYEFQQQVNLSFEEAVITEKQARIDSFIVYSRSLFADTSKVEILAKFNEKDQRTHFSVRDKDSDDPYTTLSYEDDKRILNHLDSINFEITLDRFMESIRASIEIGSIYYWTQVIGDKMIRYADSTAYDEKHLGNIFRENLKKRRIGTKFQIKRLDQDSLQLSDVPETDYQTPEFSTEFTGRKSIKVVAIMEAPFADILGRIKGTLLGALINIMLIGFSFFILLKVIFKQKKLSQIKDDFIDNITHELQTPIATLMAANEGMAKYQALEDPEKSKRYLAISKTELERLSKMVDNILMSSIHQRERMALQYEQVNVQEIIRHIAKRHTLKTDHNVQFIFDFQDPKLEIETDKFHLQNILDNLIENAIKYNIAEQKTITIATKHIHKELKLIVSDNGIGISEKDKEKVFEKFYRNPAVHNRIKGFGIGLYYVKNILDELGGSIHLHSDAAHTGTSIEITLPLTLHEV